MTPRPTTDVFDEPTAWRAEAAAALGLEDDDLIAALSPGAAFPAVLRTVRDALPPTVVRLVDLGAGAGGASEWLRRATGADVVAVEPAATAAVVAATTFPALHVVRGRAAAAPLTEATADVVTLCGVLSLVTEAGPVLDEARRLLRPGGALAVADLWAAGAADVRTGRNVFRSLESMRSLLRRHGFVVSDVGCGRPEMAPSWSAAAESVLAWIAEHRTGSTAYREWLDDQEHLSRQVRAGQVLGGCVVARPMGTARADDQAAARIGGAGEVGSGIGGSAGIGAGIGSSGRSGNGRVGGGSVGVSNMVAPSWGSWSAQVVPGQTVPRNHAEGMR